MTLPCTEPSHWSIKVSFGYSDRKHLSRVSGGGLSCHLLPDSFKRRCQKLNLEIFPGKAEALHWSRAPVPLRALKAWKTLAVRKERKFLMVLKETQRYTQSWLKYFAGFLFLRSDMGYYINCIATCKSVSVSLRYLCSIYVRKTNITKTQQASIFQKKPIWNSGVSMTAGIILNRSAFGVS